MGIIDVLNSVPKNVNPGDYLQDGVLFCVKCNTPKEFELQGILRPIMCECVSAEQKASEAARKERERQDRIKDNIRYGLTSQAYKNYTFENDDLQNPETTTLCKKYVEEWKENKRLNRGVIFLGKVGAGKSFFACCIANALLQKGVRATELTSTLSARSRISCIVISCGL